MPIKSGVLKYEVQAKNCGIFFAANRHSTYEAALEEKKTLLKQQLPSDVRIVIWRVIGVK